MFLGAGLCVCLVGFLTGRAVSHRSRASGQSRARAGMSHLMPKRLHRWMSTTRTHRLWALRFTEPERRTEMFNWGWTGWWEILHLKSSIPQSHFVAQQHQKLWTKSADVTVYLNTGELSYNALLLSLFKKKSEIGGVGGMHRGKIIQEG